MTTILSVDSTSSGTVRSRPRDSNVNMFQTEFSGIDQSWSIHKAELHDMRNGDIKFKPVHSQACSPALGYVAEGSPGYVAGGLVRSITSFGHQEESLERYGYTGPGQSPTLSENGVPLT
jgi:hypothetical protein